MILDLFKLDGKVAVVTGANTGLGQGQRLSVSEDVPVRKRKKRLKHLAEALQRYWQICQQPQQ